jgi:uncharacterized protein with ATP-grasp and redox domains
MKTYLECWVCFVRQSLESGRYLGIDDAKIEAVMRRVAGELSQLDMTVPPPVMGKRVHHYLRDALGVADPYVEQKDHFNRFAMALRDDLRKRMAASGDPLMTAVQVAVAGNIIDFGIHVVDAAQVTHAVDHALASPLDANHLAQFRRELDSAKTLLYLHDNTGEIVFDTLLIEHLRQAYPSLQITSVVKARPIINDATMADAIQVGLTELVEVIDNGDDAPGTVLADSSEELVRRFESAELIISKGQGNYEMLSERTDRPLWFLLKAKCGTIARHLHVPIGTVIFQRAGGGVQG